MSEWTKGQVEAEQRGEQFADALFGIIAEFGPSDLDTREQLELGHHLVLTTTDWVRDRNVRKALAKGSDRG